MYAAAAKKQGFLQAALEHLQVMSATNSLKLYAVKNILPLHRQQLLKVFLTAIKVSLGTAISAKQSLKRTFLDQLLDLFDANAVDSNTGGVLLGSKLIT